MPLFEVDATRPLLVQSARDGAGGSGGAEPGVHTSAHQVVESHIDGLLGEQVFPIVQGTSPEEPHLLALDASGSPVVVELVTDLDRDNLTKALDHAGAAGRLTRTELAARYHGGAQAFAHDVAAFYDKVPVTRSQQSKGGSARLIIICQNAPEEILNAVEFLRQPSMPVEVLKMGVVHSADGRRFLDVSPLVIHLPPGLPMPKKKTAPQQVSAPRPAPANLPPADAFAEGVKVGYALTGKMPVIAQAPQSRGTTAERTPPAPVATDPRPVDPAPSVASLRARLAQGKAAESGMAQAAPPAAPASPRPAGGTRAGRRALAAAQAGEAAPAAPAAALQPPAPSTPAPRASAPLPALPRSSALPSDPSSARPALSPRRSEVSESIPAVPPAPAEPRAQGSYESAPFGATAYPTPDPAPVRRRSRSDRFSGQVDGEAAPISAHTPVPPPPVAPSPVPPPPAPAQPAADLWQPPTYDGPPTRETPVYAPPSYDAPAYNAPAAYNTPPTFGAPAAFAAPPAPADDNPVEYDTRPFDVESTFGAPEYEPPTFATSPGYEAPAGYGDVPTYDSVPANDSYSSSGFASGVEYGARPSYDRAAYEPAPAAGYEPAPAAAGYAREAGGYAREAGGYAAEPPGFTGEQAGYSGEYGGYTAPPPAPFEPPYLGAPVAGAEADDRPWDQGFVGAGYDAGQQAYDETPAVPVPPDIRTGTPMLFEDEDDPDLAALARSIGAPTRIVWSRPRRNQHYEALLHPDGAIELADGSRYRHPDSAATAASGSYTADGWSVWRLGDTGPTLTDAFRMRFA